MLAERFGTDRNAADWRRFGRLPGFTNCKPQHRNQHGFFRSCGCTNTEARRLRLPKASMLNWLREESRSRPNELHCGSGTCIYLLARAKASRSRTSAHRCGMQVDPQPQIWPSALPPSPLACRSRRSPTRSNVTTCLTIQARLDVTPTSVAPSRRHCAGPGRRCAARTVTSLASLP